MTTATQVTFEDLQKQMQELSYQMALMQEAFCMQPRPQQILQIDANRLYDAEGMSNLLESKAVVKLTLAVPSTDPKYRHYLSYELDEQRARDVGTPEAVYTAHQRNKLKENFSQLVNELTPILTKEISKI